MTRLKAYEGNEKINHATCENLLLRRVVGFVLEQGGSLVVFGFM